MTSYQKVFFTKKENEMSLLEPQEKPLKPAEFAEHQIIQAILDKSYQPGDALPAERTLAQSLGVTRPTLRETLQRLSKEGWVTISHGKPTRVNDYLSQGGLGILNTLARHGDYLTGEMTLYLLEARTLILPGIAQQAVEKGAETILAYLETFEADNKNTEAFTRFDWGLQILMVETAQNPVFKMIFNDFAPIYRLLGHIYFSTDETKKKSMQYYRDLKAAISKKQDVYSIVEKTMKEAHDLWEAVS